MVKQLSIDNEVLKQIPDLREEVRNKVFQKPLDKRYKWLFATIVLMGILIVFRLLTHIVLWVPMEHLTATERVLLRKKESAKNELQWLQNSKLFFDKNEAIQLKRRNYYTECVQLFTSFQRPLGLQEVVFNEEGIVIKMNPIQQAKTAKEIKDLYKNLNKQNPNLSFSEKSTNNRFLLCGTRK